MNKLGGAHVEEVEPEGSLKGSFRSAKDAHRTAKRALERELRE